MPIIEVRPSRTRTLIGWYGAPPDDKVRDIFRDRGFAIEVFADADFLSSGRVAAAAAVVFAQDPNRAAGLNNALQKYGKTLLDHGCQIIISLVTAHKLSDGGLVSLALPVIRVLGEKGWQIAGTAVLNRIERSMVHASFEGDPPLPHVHLFVAGTPWNLVANAISVTDQQPPPNASLRIELSGRPLAKSDEVLVRRAFEDCSSVHLVPMDEEGNSGAKVFRAYPDLQDGHLGPWPQPHFVKLGPREKIFQEYQNYATVVAPYVPFHLGPRLISKRCHLGATRGVIVGDLVDRAESLRECAAHGRAGHAIASLFHTTLRGWYRCAKAESVPLTKLTRVPRFDGANRRLAQAADLGAHKTPLELQQLFEQSKSLLPVLIGPIHGDLHASNILVRGHDAILIDFFAHKEAMPVLFDVACLEASFLVDGFASDERDTSEWLQSVLPLYNEPLLLKPCAAAHPKEPSDWFYHCVNHLRIIARDMQRNDGQYAAALAIALLRKASKDVHLSDKEGLRRAAAYVLAEKVLVETFGRALAASAVRIRVRHFRRRMRRIDCIRRYGK